MSSMTPVPIDLAFVPAQTPMFADLIEMLRIDQALSDTRRRDLISGLRRVAKALGRSPEDVPCHGRWLQPRLARITPAALGLTAKSWQNAVSDARAAMAHVGLVERRINRATNLSPEWQRLWAIVLASGDRTLQPALSRFAYFLDRMGIPPKDVRDEHAHAYRKALVRNEISKSPDVAYRAAVNGWNLATRRISDWPPHTLPLPSRQKIIRLPDSDLPQDFREDLDKLLARLAKPDPLAEHGPTRALRPATLKQYRRQLIRFASELVHAGVAVDEITGLHVLINPGMAERGLRQMLSRTENKTTKLIGETAALLRNLGRLLDAPKETRAALRRLAERLATEPQRGMTPKNRERLRVLQDEAVQFRLLSLPEKIFARPEGGMAPYTWRLAREDALAIATLLACPLRIKNIAGLHLEHHVQRPGDGQVYLVLEDQDTKTGRPIEFALPRDVVKLLDAHLATRCPEMCAPGTPWLFPRRDGQGPIEPNALSARLTKRLWKEVGIKMNAHLFRHFAVMIWLDANPGGYEVARRLLGHSEISHTINMYSGLEVRSAMRVFSELLEQKKASRR
ncbi:MAG: site-specific integrase [Paracoccaceae bacterium]